MRRLSGVVLELGRALGLRVEEAYDYEQTVEYARNVLKREIKKLREMPRLRPEEKFIGEERVQCPLQSVDSEKRTDVVV